MRPLQDSTVVLHAPDRFFFQHRSTSIVIRGPICSRLGLASEVDLRWQQPAVSGLLAGTCVCAQLALARAWSKHLAHRRSACHSCTWHPQAAHSLSRRGRKYKRQPASRLRDLSVRPMEGTGGVLTARAAGTLNLVFRSRLLAVAG